MKKSVTVWTDGSCIGNPGPGGYAALLVCGEHRRELSGGYRLTTNNRMELMAVIAALKALKFPCSVAIHSDARYVVDGAMNTSMRRWRNAGWYRRLEPVPNADLWEELLSLCEVHEVTFSWVRGHLGDSGNERCDELSRQAALSGELAIDEGYETPSFPPPLPSLFDLES